MMGIENYGGFLVAGILLNITPGADTMYVLGRSISQGKRAGIMSVLGMSSGLMVHTLLASFGLSVILAQSMVAFNVVKYAGAAYLMYLGVQVLLSSPGALAPKEAKTDGMLKIYFQGMVTNLLNPKVALFFLALLPQFVSTNNHHGAFPFLILGLTFITTGTIWCAILSLCSARASEKIGENKKMLGFMNRAAGIVFIGLGLNLIRARMSN